VANKTLKKLIRPCALIKDDKPQGQVSTNIVDLELLLIDVSQGIFQEMVGAGKASGRRRGCRTRKTKGYRMDPARSRCVLVGHSAHSLAF